MPPGEQWYFRGMPAHALLRARPAAFSAFLSLGIDPWSDPAARLEALAQARGVPWEAFAAALDALADPDPDREPEGLSLPELLDRLTAEHLLLLNVPVPPSGADAAAASHWVSFKRGMAAHIREEEDFLFPRILRYAWFARHGGRFPDLTGGSVNVFIALRLIEGEKRQAEAMSRMRPQEADPANDPWAAWEARLRRHACIEEQILYPKAKDMEKALFDAAISGGRRLASPDRTAPDLAPI